jgi:hypothetical protein
MQLILTDTQDCVLTVTAKDKKLAPASTQNPVWASSDPSILTVTPDSSDPNKAVISAQVPGTAMITYTADADLTDGVFDVIGTLDVVVGAGQAVVIEIAAGTPTEQP